MNPLYDAALRGIGAVAVAHTILDLGCRTLLKRFAHAGLARAKSNLTVGGQLGLLRKAKPDPRLASMASQIAVWIEAADAANETRNRVIHDAMFYGEAAVFPGLVQMRDGKPQLVDPRELEALRQTLTDLGMTGMRLASEAAILLGEELPKEEEDEGAAGQSAGF